MHPADPYSEETSKGELSSFLRYLSRKSGRRGLWALALQLAGSLTEGVSVLLLVPILTLVNRTESNPTVTLPDGDGIGVITRGAEVGLPLALTALVVVVILMALFNRLRMIFTADLVYELLNDLRLDLVRAITQARWTAFVRSREADLTHILTGDIDRVQSATASTLSIFQNLFSIAVYLAASLFISVQMTLLAAVIGAVMLVVLTPLRRHARRLGRSITSNRRSQYRMVSDMVTGMKMTKRLNAEAGSLHRLEDTLGEMRRNTVTFVSASSWGSAGFNIFSVAGLAIFVWVALTRTQMPLPELVILLFVFMRIAPRFLTTQSLWQQVLQNLPAFHAIRSMTRYFEDRREVPSTDVQAPPLNDRIVLRNLFFGYGDDTPNVLSDVSMVLRKGEVTAVIGPSGSGKSTLADLLMGLLEPDRGEILVDGTEIDASLKRAWRRQVAFVPQDVLLLHDTIANNLRLARPDATDSDIEEALRSAHAWTFVSALPHGIHTNVGDRGLWLSGGERQRIALAQALLRKPRLLILDEATSALDWETQASIAKAIAGLKGDMTILTIAHRPSMISFADRVVALSDGKVAETGGYAELSADGNSRLSRMLATEENRELTAS
ncbi:ABC transporter ATP-binding protein [Marivita sp.]|uniref:ABC transporter ATP-binding protein n=1 Tax=Marivita sp. TaxID=2003365 RepID=UPI0025BED492|nr:ABC transporter ATP-binding protein [Marivita sp.]